MKPRLTLAEHQKTAAHHLYVGFAAGVIVTAGIALLIFAFFLDDTPPEEASEPVPSQIDLSNF